jgi:sugar phosphate isomerase/epimerase
MDRRQRRHFSRRDFLKAAAAGAGVGLVGFDRLAAAAKFAGPAGKNIPVGVQLYSVREAAAKDLPAVLQALAKMGYKGVEFAGYYGWENKPAELRKLLDDNGLKCCGTHTDLETVTGDALKTTAELNHILGNPYLIVPSLTVEGADAWKAMAAKFNDIAAKAGALGARVGYHAHQSDFKNLGDTTPWEIFFDNTNKDVIMQIDTGNCLQGGGDPVAMLKKYPGRSTTVHIKDFGGSAESVIGEGKVRWAEVFEACEGTGGTAWYIVEHETGTHPLESVKGCLEGLRKMGRGLGA